MKKICLLVINSLMLIILLFSMVGCINNDGQSSKDSAKSYFGFCYSLDDDHLLFGANEDVTINLYYWSHVTRDEELLRFNPDYAELYVSSHPGGVEDAAKIANRLSLEEMDLLFVVEAFYADKYPAHQVSFHKRTICGEPTKILAIPKELFLYETGKILLDFEYFNGRQRTFVLYTKTNEEIELKKSVFSFESYSENWFLGLIINIVVDWDIDINNYDYEAMKQTALDYMAYIIRNVQPPIV